DVLHRLSLFGLGDAVGYWTKDHARVAFGDVGGPDERIEAAKRRASAVDAASFVAADADKRVAGTIVAAAKLDLAGAEPALGVGVDAWIALDFEGVGRVRRRNERHAG